MTSPIVFGTALRRAIKDAGMTNQKVADATGISKSWISALSCGKAIPMHRTAVVLADALEAPLLLTLSLRMHTRACEACGMAFVDGSRQSLRRFCCRSCKRLIYKRRQRGIRRETIALSRHRLKVIQSALNDFCMNCNGGTGLCWDSECIIQQRGLGPPLEPRRAARVA